MRWDDERKVAEVVYDYSDRKNGWYVQLMDSEGNQIGSAEYRYRKDDAMHQAAEWAAEHNVKMRRA